MWNFLKQQLLFETLKYSVKRNVKVSAKKAQEKYKKSNFKKRVDGLMENYKNSEVKDFVDETTDTISKKYNETRYVIKNGESLKFKEVDLTYEQVIDLLRDGEFKMKDGLVIKIMDDKECFTSKTYFLRKTSVIFLMKEHFYKNENIEIKLV